MPTPDLPASADGAEPEILAAELALGLLEGDDRAAALRRQLADPAFAREVEHWREHFAGLFAAMPAESPPPHLAEQVGAQVEGGTIDRRPAPLRAAPGLWRPLALTSSLAAALMAAVLVMRPPPVAPAPPGVVAPLVAALAPADRGAPLPALYDPARKLVRMPAPMPIPQGRSAQLWAIVDGGRPIPLGLFRIVGSTIVADAPGNASMRPGTMLAISFEPLGGSPTGQPTGPVVASGALGRV